MRVPYLLDFVQEQQIYQAKLVPSTWLPLSLLLAVVAVYLYNFMVLPLDPADPEPVERQRNQNAAQRGRRSRAEAAPSGLRFMKLHRACARLFCCAALCKMETEPPVVAVDIAFPRPRGLY